MMPIILPRLSSRAPWGTPVEIARARQMSGLSIIGGSVVDGMGSPPRRADVRVEGGRIAEIGTGVATSDRALDARGMLVIPGVIDIHTHDDFTLPLRPEATARVRQGITTTVTGNCGFSPFPLDTSCPSPPPRSVLRAAAR